jgi:purine-binding chemotaxis protein CheW
MVETTTADTNGAERFVIFTLGEEAYGLPIGAVEEVVRMPDQLTRVPKAPKFVEGVMNLRGRIVPVIDQRDRFQAPAASASARRRVIITSVRGLQAGFAVDDVREILEFTPDQLRSTPELAAEGGKTFDRVGTVSVDGRMVLLVDPEALLDKAEADLLAALAKSNPTKVAPAS